MSAVADLPYRSTLALDLRIADWRRSTERRLHFDSPTHTRVNSDSCVNDGYCLRHFSVDTAPSTYFSPFPSRILPRSTRTMTASGQLRSSISLPGYHVDFFTFAEHVSFEHSTGSPWPVIYSGREGNSNKQTYKTQKFLHTRTSIRHGRIALFMRLCRALRDLALAPRLSVATESTGTVLPPSQMSEIAGHDASVIERCVTLPVGTWSVARKQSFRFVGGHVHNVTTSHFERKETKFVSNKTAIYRRNRSSVCLLFVKLALLCVFSSFIRPITYTRASREHALDASGSAKPEPQQRRQ